MLPPRLHHHAVRFPPHHTGSCLKIGSTVEVFTALRILTAVPNLHVGSTASATPLVAPCLSTAACNARLARTILPTWILKWPSSPPRGLVMLWLLAVCGIIFSFLFLFLILGERFLNPVQPTWLHKGPGTVMGLLGSHMIGAACLHAPRGAPCPCREGCSGRETLGSRPK